jgi:hypothetical protein
VLLNGTTIINQSGVTYNGLTMGNGNSVTISRVGFIFTKGASEVSTYNTYLDNFTIYNLGANTAILGDGYAATDTQYKGITVATKTDTISSTDISYKGFTVTKVESISFADTRFYKGITITSLSDTEMISDFNKVIRGWTFNDSISIIDGNYEKISKREIVYIFGSKPIIFNQQIIQRFQSAQQIIQQLDNSEKIIQSLNMNEQIISNKNNQ